MNPGHQSETMTEGIIDALNEEIQENSAASNESKSDIVNNNENLGTTNDLMSFPRQTSRLNDNAYPCMRSLEFPTLLPCSRKGDVTDRYKTSEASATDPNKHLLKHSMRDEEKDEHAHPLANHNHWMHWAQDTAERHRLNG